MTVDERVLWKSHCRVCSFPGTLVGNGPTTASWVGSFRLEGMYVNMFLIHTALGSLALSFCWCVWFAMPSHTDNVKCQIWKYHLRCAIRPDTFQKQSFRSVTTQTKSLKINSEAGVEIFSQRCTGSLEEGVFWKPIQDSSPPPPLIPAQGFESNSFAAQ